MGLFQKSVLTNYLTSVSDSDIEKGWNSLISYKEMDSKVQTLKEEEFVISLGGVFRGYDLKLF